MSVNSLVGVDLGEGGGVLVWGGEENNLFWIVCIIMVSWIIKWSLFDII